MLKTCLDCVLGSGGAGRESESAYGARLNGDAQRAPALNSHTVPAWPPTGEVMFLLPRALAVGDEVTVSGLMRNSRETLDISLVTGDYAVDNQNVACQFSADFTSDTVSVSVIQNGVKELIGDSESYPAATDLMPEQDFSFIFKINISEYESEPSFNIYCGLSYVAAVKLKYDLKHVRYLTLGGDVEKVDSLQFKFS